MKNILALILALGVGSSVLAADPTPAATAEKKPAKVNGHKKVVHHKKAAKKAETKTETKTETK